jgi:hypothetical protein
MSHEYDKPKTESLINDTNLSDASFSDNRGEPLVSLPNLAEIKGPTVFLSVIKPYEVNFVIIQHINTQDRFDIIFNFPPRENKELEIQLLSSIVQKTLNSPDFKFSSGSLNNEYFGLTFYNNKKNLSYEDVVTKVNNLIFSGSGGDKIFKSQIRFVLLNDIEKLNSFSHEPLFPQIDRTSGLIRLGEKGFFIGEGHLAELASIIESGDSSLFKQKLAIATVSQPEVDNLFLKAVALRETSIAKQLLENGALPSIENHYCYGLAINQGDRELFKLLLKYNTTDLAVLNNSLSLAVIKGDKELTELILEKLDLNSFSVYRAGCIAIVADNLELLDVFLNSSESATSYLSFAVENRKEIAIERLLDLGVEANNLSFNWCNFPIELSYRLLRSYLNKGEREMKDTLAYKLLHIIDKCSDVNKLSETQQYVLARQLMAACFRTPYLLDRAAHHLQAIFTSLEDNSLNDTSRPHLTQLNITSLHSYVGQTLNNLSSFSFGSMFVQVLGFLGQDVSIKIDEDQQAIHPNYKRAVLRKKNSCIDIFYLPDRGFSRFNKSYFKAYNPEFTELRPLGIKCDYFSVYYITKNNLIFSICLDKGETARLFKEGQPEWKRLTELFNDYYYNSIANRDLATEQFNKIVMPTQLYNWLESNFAFFNSELKDNIKLSWRDLSFIVNRFKDNFSTIELELITGMIHGHQFLQESVGVSENRDLIRLMASDDISIFFKIAETLKFGVFSGTSLNNSHQAAIKNLISQINYIEKKQNLKTVLIKRLQVADSSGQTSYQTIDNPFIYGKELLEADGAFSEQLKLAIKNDKEINVNGKLIPPTEVFSYVFMMGDKLYKFYN